MNKIKSQSNVVNAWCMYDWANSVYSLVITTAIFPLYYNSVTTTSENNDIVSFFGIEIVNSVLYSYSLSQTNYWQDPSKLLAGAFQR